MVGTIRTLDKAMRKTVHERIRRIADNIAESAGATAEVNIGGNLPVTYNDPDLTAKMLPTLERILGKDGLVLSQMQTGGEDFAYYADAIPGLFIILGVRPKGTGPEDSVPLHSPHLIVDEDELLYGVRALANMTVDYMEMKKEARFKAKSIKV